MAKPSQAKPTYTRAVVTLIITPPGGGEWGSETLKSETAVSCRYYESLIKVSDTSHFPGALLFRLFGSRGESEQEFGHCDRFGSLPAK